MDGKKCKCGRCEKKWIFDRIHFTPLHLLHLIRFGSLTNKKIEKVQTQKGTPHS